MKLYVVVNKEGKFFRSIGYGGFRENWVSNLEQAKFYPKIGQAKSRCTFFFNNYPDYGCPSILEFTINRDSAVVVNMDEETKKAIKKIELRKLRLEERDRDWKLRCAQKSLEELQQRINKLKK